MPEINYATSVPDITTAAAPTSTSSNSTTSSTLSNWAAPYVTDMLGKTQAVSESPYALYEGDMTAGPSALQNQAFQGVASLTLPKAGDYTAGTFNGSTYNPMQYSSYLPGTSSSQPYGVGSIDSYMNPYIQGAINPALNEARRQAEITRINNAARLTGQGAYGGSRQAILEAENDRNLGQLQSDIYGKGYASAYDNAQNQQYRTAQMGMDAQKATDASRQFGANYGLDTQKAAEQAKQFGANYGLDAGKMGIAGLDQMLRAGDTQRGIEQEGLTADYNEFARQRDYPQQQLKFQQSMLQGLPIATTTNTPNPVSDWQNMIGAATGVASLWDMLSKLGI